MSVEDEYDRGFLHGVQSAREEIDFLKGEIDRADARGYRRAFERYSNPTVDAENTDFGERP